MFKKKYNYNKLPGDVNKIILEHFTNGINDENTKKEYSDNLFQLLSKIKLPNFKNCVEEDFYEEDKILCLVYKYYSDKKESLYIFDTYKRQYLEYEKDIPVRVCEGLDLDFILSVVRSKNNKKENMTQKNQKKKIKKNVKKKKTSSV